MSHRYQFTPRDAELLWAAALLLRKVMASGKIRPAQMVTLAKLHHILTVLPRATESVTASVSVCSPKRKFGEIETFHWWDFGAEGETLRIYSGGHYYHPRTGGDTFRSIDWTAVPGSPTEFDDFSATLGVVPDLLSYLNGVESIDFSAAEYKLEILDTDNPLLDECGEEEDESQHRVAEDEQENLVNDELVASQGISEPWSITPIDSAEERLAALVSPDQVNAREPAYAHGVENCDYCGCILDQRGLHVDGRLRDDLMWGNMCAACFGNLGEGIGWGNGQLYARQANGDWRLVAGFGPEEE